ncbi:sensor histidine kinase [Roseovarius atlanticus]|uniref:sensor histidine kinase n=1 Tax=Roseovarius atlanticus TaxID=1641875 RepID=UPI0009E9DA17|nr:HAMP domain-containing sensor histidine kinase [Roseovarius atlanticus]
MRTLLKAWSPPGDWFTSQGREQRIKDYMVLSNGLIWQRQASFFAAAVLAAFYFDPLSVFACYSVVLLTEMLDQILGAQAKSWDGVDPVFGRKLLKRIAANTAISALAISVFIANIAVQQNAGGQFTSLFFLFSASLFAAMYNSQMIGILILRLSIYSVTFLFIAFLDVLRFAPPITSPIWLQFFTIMFVLYFIVDNSAKFYRGYQDRLQQMKLIEEENERTKAALEIKSQFLSTVSHELRTPLTSIIGSLELVNNGVLGEMPQNFKPVIDMATKNSRRLANLIDDLLDLQKIEAGEIDFQMEPICSNDLAREAIDSISGYASMLGISLELHVCKDECQIMGDRKRLIQVMNNLLSNALKFSKDDDAVKVFVENVGSRVRISVEDKGAGIPDFAEERVFGKFSQLDSSDVRRVGGTGLGLNISKQIVESHNAEIGYVSALGVGSTFHVDFERLEVMDRDEANVENMSEIYSCDAGESADSAPETRKAS